MSKYTLMAFLVLITLTHCRQREDVKSLRAVRLSADVPVVTADTGYVIHKSYDIFYNGHVTMYKFDYTHDSFFNGRLVTHELRPDFFVFQNDSSFGYNYYPIADPMMPGGRMRIDSMFSKNGFGPFSFDSAFKHHQPDSLYFNGDHDLVKVYTIDSSAQYPERNTYYLYYSKKFKGLEDNFFSRSAGDENGFKLFKIRIIAHGSYYPGYNMVLPQREQVYEMKDIDINNTAEIMTYFGRYRKEVLKY